MELQLLVNKTTLIFSAICHGGSLITEMTSRFEFQPCQLNPKTYNLFLTSFHFLSKVYLCYHK